MTVCPRRGFREAHGAHALTPRRRLGRPGASGGAVPPRAASKMRSLHFWTLQVGWQVWSGQHLWDPVAGALPDLLHRLRRLAHRRASHHAGNVDRRVQAHLGRRDRRRHLPHGTATAGLNVRPGFASAAAPPAPRPAWWLELCRTLWHAPARGCGRPPFLDRPPQGAPLGPHPAAPCTLHTTPWCVGHRSSPTVPSHPCRNTRRARRSRWCQP